MAATTQLAKIADLTERLAPLAGKQRGMPIEHDDWNALVDVLRGLLEIDHAQEDSAQSDLEQRFALKEHDHLGQVTLAWLDPSLQSAVGELRSLVGGASKRAKAHAEPIDEPVVAPKLTPKILRPAKVPSGIRANPGVKVVAPQIVAPRLARWLVSCWQSMSPMPSARQKATSAASASLEASVRWANIDSP